MVLIDSSQWVWLSHTLQTISRWCCILLHNVAWSIQKSLIRRHQCPSANLTLALRTSHPAGWDNLVGQSLGWRFVEVNYLPLSLKERCLVCWNERSLSQKICQHHVLRKCLTCLRNRQSCVTFATSRQVSWYPTGMWPSTSALLCKWSHEVFGVAWDRQLVAIVRGRWSHSFKDQK